MKSTKSHNSVKTSLPMLRENKSNKAMRINYIKRLSSRPPPFVFFFFSCLAIRLVSARAVFRHLSTKITTKRNTELSGLNLHRCTAPTGRVNLISNWLPSAHGVKVLDSLIRPFYIFLFRDKKKRNKKRDTKAQKRKANK